MAGFTDITGKFQEAMKLALSPEAGKGIAIVDVANPREAELLLEMIRAVGGPHAGLLRERIHAIALFEPSGLNVKRLDTEWEALQQISPPAVLLCPSGIRSRVMSDERIQLGTSSSQEDRGCLTGCLVAVAIAAAAFLFWPRLLAMFRIVDVYQVLTTETGKGALPKTRFRAHPDAQVVESWIPGSEDTKTRMTTCSVRDRLNWRCESPDGLAVLTMSNGIYSEFVKDPAHRQSAIRVVSRWEWWKTKLSP